MARNLWTKDIRLEEISLELFVDIERDWGYEMPKDKPRTYARMYDAPQADTYEALINTFLEHPYAKRINVRDGLEWKRFKAMEIKEAEKIEIVRLATKDALQANHFEMKFDLQLPNVVIPSQQLVELEFARRNGKIVGYKVRLHRRNLQIFDSQIKNPAYYVAAIYQ